jgi:hypothetical protein
MGGLGVMELVATQQGVLAVAAFSFLGGSAAVFVAQALGRVWDRWNAPDPFDDPRNWH